MSNQCFKFECFERKYELLSTFDTVVNFEKKILNIMANSIFSYQNEEVLIITFSMFYQSVLFFYYS